MSYRFRNRGEKSDLQRTYEHISSKTFGTEFNVHTIMSDVGIPQNTASASLAYLSNNGMLEKLKDKIRPKGKNYPVIVYRYVKNIDKSQHSKPIEHKRVVTKLKPKKVKPAKVNRDVPIIGTALLDLEKLKKISDAVLQCCIDLEIFMNEIKEAKDGKIQTSVRSASELPIWDGTPEKDRK